MGSVYEFDLRFGGGVSEDRGVNATTDTITRDSQTTAVEAALDALLAAHDPKTTGPIAFRGARFDAGLAWVHFPV